MDGRFPLDSNGGQGPNQLNANQLRAALGLGFDEALYLQQHAHQQQHRQHQIRQQHEQQQREMQLHRLILQQEQMEHRNLQEQQLRATIDEQLHSLPAELQQRYRNQLLSDQLGLSHQGQRHDSGSATGGINAFGGAAAATSMQQQLAVAVAQQQQQQQQALYEQRFEQLLLQQQQQQLGMGLFPDDLGQSNHAQSAATVLMAAQQQRNRQLLMQQQQQPQNVPPLAQQLLSQNLANIEALSTAGPNLASAVSNSLPSLAVANQNLAAVTAASMQSDQRELYEVDGSTSPLLNGAQTTAPKRKRAQSTSATVGIIADKSLGRKKAKKKRDKVPVTRGKNSIPSQQKYIALDATSPTSIGDSDEYDADGGFDAFVTAADIRLQQQEEVVVKGTLESLIQAVVEYEKLEDDARFLAVALQDAKPWIETEEDQKARAEVSAFGLPTPRVPALHVESRNFKSSIPNLPEEPLFLEELYVQMESDPEEAFAFGGDSDVDVATEFKSAETKETPKTAKKAAAVAYPCPVDTWWPSISGMRRERKSSGESSDEDNFEDDPVGDSQFRANARKIRNRLSRSLQPGLLEKLPHCRIHRIKTKRKKSSAPELVYCWQVTELYPQEIMVNCSRCGTWRHAACGGHHKHYSVRDNTETPFIAVCEHCKVEEKYLREYPVGNQRIERQRSEQLRRGLSTSTVMRHSSYSKHGGTYKWPLGSVSATHIGGHTRSVHARHDKAERQWNDMASRLGRGLGYRPKERVRSRTKELERLLVAIEDAEAFTDRHNMFLFLQRDTKKAVPSGFENEFRNIFDPADDDCDGDQPSSSRHWDEVALAAKNIIPTGGDGESIANAPREELCARVECQCKQRFDSRFCSDACGVATLELSLLHTLQDSSEIHPSVLRL